MARPATAIRSLTSARGEARGARFQPNSAFADMSICDRSRLPRASNHRSSTPHKSRTEMALSAARRGFLERSRAAISLQAKSTFESSREDAPTRTTCRRQKWLREVTIEHAVRRTTTNLPRSALSKHNFALGPTTHEHAPPALDLFFPQTRVPSVHPKAASLRHV